MNIYGVEFSSSDETGDRLEIQTMTGTKRRTHVICNRYRFRMAYYIGNNTYTFEDFRAKLLPMSLDRIKFDITTILNKEKAANDIYYYFSIKLDRYNGPPFMIRIYFQVPFSDYISTIPDPGSYINFVDEEGTLFVRDNIKIFGSTDYVVTPYPQIPKPPRDIFTACKMKCYQLRVEQPLKNITTSCTLITDTEKPLTMHIKHEVTVNNDMSFPVEYICETGETPVTYSIITPSFDLSPR